MRSPALRGATTIVVAILVVGCASTPSVSPTTSSGPQSSTTPSSAVSSATAPGSTLSPALPPKIVAISAGYGHTCALTAGGGVKCWGSNGGGQLGDGTTTDRTTPVDVVGLGSGIVAISAGSGHTCAITTGGGVKCWGSNEWGALGNGTKTSSLSPVDVSGLASGVTAISAGLIHTCALTTGRGVKCWGYNGFGGLGNGAGSEHLVPVDVQGLTRGVSAIATGYEHSCALTTTGGVKCWGSRDGSALGNGSTTNSFSPVDVLGFRSEGTAIAAGPEHVCAAKTGGEIFCWGSNYGNTPAQIVGDPGDVPALTAGATHSCVVTGAGGVSCWGFNQYGQLGNGSTTESAHLVDVLDLAAGVSAVDAGYDHTCALGSDGLVKCWGDNWTGQLGNGRPCGSRASATVAVDVAFTEAPESEPPPLPSGPIEHEMGPTDVVLRFDFGPDLAVSDLTGELFQPGPEFTLYGDGTAILRTDRQETLPAEGPILRAWPFAIAHLTEDQVQDLLHFALGEGGLTTACEVYESRDLDGIGSLVFTVRTGALSRRIEAFGENPLGPVIDRLIMLDRTGNVPMRVWGPDRFRGSLFELGPYEEGGVIPNPAEVGSLAWPWPGVTPNDFVTPPDPGWESPRRVMSAAEAAVHDFSIKGGLVKRVYLRGPDGRTLYYFSMWPVFPDETS